MAEQINIPEEILTFFKQHGRYVPGKITYDAVIGKNAEEIPEDLAADEELASLFEEWPFKNMDEKSRQEADAVVTEALRYIFHNGRYSDIQKSYMVNTGTIPVRVKYKKAGGHTREALYVKQANTNRIIGRFFYDVISGKPMPNWGFNEHVFLEQGIHATPLSRLNERVLLESHDYQEGLVRAAVHAELLLEADMVRARNRLVDYRQRTILFDFDQVFGKPGSEPSHLLLDSYLKSKQISGEWILDVVADEQHSILRRIYKNEREFFRFVEIAGSLQDLAGRTLNSRMRLHGAKSLEDYFEQRFDGFRGM